MDTDSPSDDGRAKRMLIKPLEEDNGFLRGVFHSSSCGLSVSLVSFVVRLRSLTPIDESDTKVEVGEEDGNDSDLIQILVPNCAFYPFMTQTNFCEGAFKMKPP